MLSVLGPARHACDGVSRRTLLQWGGLGALGLGLPELLRSAAVGAPARPATADACILVFLFGGPSQIDTWDMKPEAPSDFRGEFRPIDTCVPGIQVCEHFSRLAQVMDRVTIVRSMQHQHPRHGYGLYYMFTGREHPRPDLDAPPTPNDFPSLGSLVTKLQGARRGFPPAVTLPRWNRFLDVPNDYAGETAGFLGKSYDPWLVKAPPNSSAFEVAGVELPGGMTLERLAQRRDLLSGLDRQLALWGDQELNDLHNTLYQQAFALVTRPEARQAFDLEQESAATRDRYGRHPFGQGMLLGRRLVEAGTRLVTVNWHDDGSDVKSPFWDTHMDNFSTLRERLIPPADEAISALIGDLSERGMLERTLVLVMGEFGRTPKVGRVVMNNNTNPTGRDHWPHAYSILLAGGGVPGGRVFGASDERAAFVTDAPISPPDLTATILGLLGCDLEARIYDRQSRPHFVTEGRPVWELL
jgi:hypothetical protein